MIILLTGLPGMGKTTVLERFLEAYKNDCFWILSKELRNPLGERVGFEAVTSDGQSGVFAHKEAIRSDDIIGSYHVDLTVVDKMFTESILREIRTPQGLFVLDEIGRMEMLSKNFVAAIDRLFETDQPVLATIRHGDEWAEKYKTHQKAVVFEITEKNREELPETFMQIFTCQKQVALLTTPQQDAWLDMMKKYARDSRFIEVKKLCDNALRYLSQSRIKSLSDGLWEVEGDHRTHQVHSSPNTSSYACDCDLFLGKGVYAGYRGECSHIQAVVLSQA
ncbi:MAG: nucleoside-triphosphatase [Patescibacteria group bacterium]